MLAGRDAQLHQIAQLIADARRGRAGVAALVGEAGMGKTALLDAAAELAGDFQLARVAGVPPEQTIGFAALGPLLAPLTGHVAALPARQQRAVLACLARDGADRSRAGDLLALGAGVLTLFAEGSRARPLLLLVDDLHWIDEESKRVVGFVARRLGGEQVVMLLAGREEGDVPPGLGVRIAVDGLDDHDAAQLLVRRRPELRADVTDQLVSRCRGNALALVESAASIDGERAQGRAPLDEAGLVPSRVREGYRHRLAALSEQTRTALLVAACEGRGEPSVLADAVAAFGVRWTDLEAAVDEGLLRLDRGRFRFQHPMLADYVSEMADLTARRAAHTVLADVLATTDRDRAVWHRATAAPGYDEGVAAALTELAARSIDAGLPEAAGRAWERAGELTGPGAGRSALFVAAAEAAVLCGSGARAGELSRRAAETGPASPDIRSRRQVVEGRLALLQGRPSEAARLFLAAAQHLRGPRRSDAIERAIAAAVELRDRGLIELVLHAADDDGAAGRRTGIHREVARLLVAYDVGDPAVDPRLAAGIRTLVHATPADASSAELMLLAAAASQIGELVPARALYMQAAGTATSSGDVPALAAAASQVAFCDFALGRWNSAYAKATEVQQLVDEQFAPDWFAEALLVHADIDSVRGHDERCLSACRRVRVLAETLGAAYLTVLADRCEGVLHLGLQRLDLAVLRLEAALTTAAAAGLTHPYASAVPDLAETYLRQGRVADAERVAAAFLSRVGPGSPPPPQARALRLRALLAPRGEYDEDFDTSVELDEGVGLRLHAARTLLCHAERLRRDGRRVDARTRLARCLDVFASLEATPWVFRAQAELEACGGGVRRSTGGTVSEVLTPQELQIAVLVAEGRRNREIAGALFLSLRTVEFHLSRVFRKLDVANRTQLATRMHG